MVIIPVDQTMPAKMSTIAQDILKILPCLVVLSKVNGDRALIGLGNL
jgi:hypothetical protein